MTQFSATDAAIEGIRLAGRKPGVILVWALAQVLVSLALGAATVLVVGADMAKITGPEAMASWTDAATRAQLLGPFLRLEAVTLPIVLLWGAVQSCAVYRAVLRPADAGLGYLRLGADELRMVGLSLLYVLLWIGAYLAFIIGAVVLGVIGGVIVAALGKGVAQGVVAVLVMLAMLAPLLAIVWALVRLSLSGPMTFAGRKIRLWGSWKLTRGHFWGLFGAYLVSASLAAVIFVAGMCVALLAGLLITGQGLGGLYQNAFHPDYGSLAAFFSLPRLVVLIIQGLFLGLVTATLYAPAAEAYRTLVGTGEAAAAPAAAGEAPAAPTGPWG